MAKRKPSAAPMKHVNKIQDWNNDEGALRIAAWARDGLTKEQIAHNIGINSGTLLYWEKVYPKIGDALKKGREVADIEVENALFKSATGYEYEEVTEERKFNPDSGEYEMVVTKKVRKFVQPNNTAQIFWLKNRLPDKWQDRRQVDNTEAIEHLDAILTEMRKTVDE